MVFEEQLNKILGNHQDRVFDCFGKLIRSIVSNGYDFHMTTKIDSLGNCYFEILSMQRSRSTVEGLFKAVMDKDGFPVTISSRNNPESKKCCTLVELESFILERLKSRELMDCLERHRKE